MNKLLIVALIALLAVSAALMPTGRYGRRWAFDEADEEEADNKVWDWIKQRKNQDKLRDWAEKGVKTYDIWRKDDEEEEEESDFINWKKIGSIAKDIGKTYLSSKYGINLDEADEEESDFINWKKIGNIAKDIGKTYLSSKYGINLDEEVDAEEESDQNRNFNFGANVGNGQWGVNGGLTGSNSRGGSYNVGGSVGSGGQWGVNGAYSGSTRGGANWNVGGNVGNGGQWGVNAGVDKTWNNGRTNFNANVGHGNNGFNAGIKFSHSFDDIEESDFINWKKVWGVAKDIGKNYIATKYGVNLDEEEEADFNWLLAAKVAAKVFKPRPAY